MSGLLFLSVIDWIMKTIMENKKMNKMKIDNNPRRSRFRRNQFGKKKV